MSWWFYFIPLISAFIGWFLNWLALKMLFHPIKQKQFLGVTFQGFFPKRQKQLAEKFGQLISNQLLSSINIEDKILDPKNLERIMPFVEGHVDVFLKEKLGEQMPMIKMFVGEKTLDQMKGIFMVELRELFPLIMEKYMNNFQQDLDVKQIIIDKVGSFSAGKLESIVKQTMRSEFKFVEIVGAVLGFFIGLVQVLITLTLM